MASRLPPLDAPSARATGSLRRGSLDRCRRGFRLMHCRRCSGAVVAHDRSLPLS